MHKKSNLTILILMLVLSAISSAKSTPTTSIYVDPETYEVAGVEQTFTINITVTEVTDLWGWEFKLFYSSTHLNSTNIGEGPFLKTAGATFFWEVNRTDNYNATHGYIHIFCILTHVIPGANGNGVIGNVTFKSKALGSSILDLTGTKLKNSKGEYMPHETRDGTIIVKAVEKLGDFDGDGDIDFDDIVYFADAYIVYWTGGAADPLCDFDSDGDIDFDDIVYFADAYIEYWTTGDP
jgi:hypothetical protein